MSKCNKNGIKREGESCTLNNNCTYPNCEIPTFEEYRQYLFKNKKPFYTNKSDAESLIEFTKLHVKQALLKASEKAKVSLTKDWIRKEETIHPNSLVSSITVKVDKQSIINAYDLNLIK